MKEGLAMAELTIKEMECLQRGLGIIEGVAACPTIDAVPVVRCKDCKHYKPPKVSAHYVNHTQYCTRVVTMKVSPDSFCSYGERKDGD